MRLSLQTKGTTASIYTKLQCLIYAKITYFNYELILPLILLNHRSDVKLWFPMILGAFWWFSVFSDVFQSYPMLNDVDRTFPRFSDVTRRFPMLTHVDHFHLYPSSRTSFQSSSVPWLLLRLANSLHIENFQLLPGESHVLLHDLRGAQKLAAEFPEYGLRLTTFFGWVFLTGTLVEIRQFDLNVIRPKFDLL